MTIIKIQGDRHNFGWATIHFLPEKICFWRDIDRFYLEKVRCVSELGLCLWTLAVFGWELDNCLAKIMYSPRTLCFFYQAMNLCSIEMNLFSIEMNLFSMEMNLFFWEMNLFSLEMNRLLQHLYNVHWQLAVCCTEKMHFHTAMNRFSLEMNLRSSEKILLL